MTPARVVAVPIRGLKVHQSHINNQNGTCICYTDNFYFSIFYLKTVKSLANDFLFQNWYLLGVQTNLEPCPQNEILIAFRAVLENF